MKADRFNLHGRTALITGAAGLLGVEHAEALLECDARVVLTDINESRLLDAQRRLSSKYPDSIVLAYKMDVTSSESISSVQRKLGEQNIRVDILVNNAAIDPKVNENLGITEGSRLEHLSREQWDIQIAVGLTGAFLCSQIFGTEMARGGKGGVILNVASDLSVLAPDQRLYKREGLADELQPVKPVTYSVIKTGLIGLTRYLATYWVEQSVRSNALSPGGIYSEQGDEFVRRLSQLIPLGRMANKDEYRAAVQFLCSDASSYMNGHNIVMDGGRSCW